MISHLGSGPARLGHATWEDELQSAIDHLIIPTWLYMAEPRCNPPSSLCRRPPCTPSASGQGLPNHTMFNLCSQQMCDDLSTTPCLVPLPTQNPESPRFIGGGIDQGSSSGYVKPLPDPGLWDLALIAGCQVTWRQTPCKYLNQPPFACCDDISSSSSMYQGADYY